MEGLGRRAGVAAGYVALVTYNAVSLMIAAFFGFFASAALDSELGISVSWIPLSLIGLALSALLAFRGVEASVRVLMVLLGIETLFLFLLNFGVLFDSGLGAYSFDSFSPSEVFSGSPGIALAFAFSTFLGFEATAVFSEEARDPRRSVARATYIAIVAIAVLYIASSWSSLASLGGAGAVGAAQEDPGGLLFGISDVALGGWSVHALNILVVTSMFAVLIASHSSASRYLYALARAGFLPRSMARTHEAFRTPYVAAAVQVVFTAIVVIIFAIAGADPLTELGATFVGLSALGVVILEIAVSIAVIAFFRRGPQADVGVFKAVVAPALAAISLTVAAVLMINNFGLLTGSESAVIGKLPLILLVAAVLGAVVGGRQQAPPVGVAEPQQQVSSPVVR